MTPPPDIASIADVCEVERFSPPGGDPLAPPDLLIEVPHGANRAAHFHAVRCRLRGDLPDDLIDFFFVNTDVGAPECARTVAAMLVAPGEHPGVVALLAPGSLAAAVDRPRSVLVLRCLVPRTLIDCNRVADAGDTDYARTGVTKGLPDYVTDPADARTLLELHAAYHQVATRAYEWTCGVGGVGGMALTLHTYAPRAVKIDTFDRGIAAALRAAYEPAVYETWPLRPEVDLITEAENGALLAPPELSAAVRSNYARIGVTATENASYRLHPATMGYRYSARYPGRVLCAEISRALLATPFSPFAEMTIGTAQVARLSAPIAAACLATP